MAPKHLGLMDFIHSVSTCTVPEPSCPADCHRSGLCTLPWGSNETNSTCGCYFGTHGPTCNETEYVEHYDCGYRCTFDQVRGTSCGTSCGTAYPGRCCQGASAPCSMERVHCDHTL